ncbi:PadR family transcriptional regulator [Pyruvatibacter sp. HU-CL02332]|uniref:PadR family transcriptional regulator n=1 Tax=Pyruvatibacter sp. HU-CL02332 TaxID=3127650 RepID=UPI002968F608|nr:PadR family transcriptional regulator [Alphaproteobacteria bacterium]
MDVRTMCLGLLAFGDASGYEIKKEFEQGPSRHFMDASFGSIYPALTKMTDEGLLACRTEPQEKRPDKKVYSLTADGWNALDAAIKQPVSQDKIKSDFSFVMMFADRLPRSRVADLIDRQIEGSREGIREFEESDAPLDSAGVSFVRRYGLAMRKAHIDFLERNRHFIEAGAQDDPVEEEPVPEPVS